VLLFKTIRSAFYPPLTPSVRALVTADISGVNSLSNVYQNVSKFLNYELTPDDKGPSIHVGISFSQRISDQNLCQFFQNNNGTILLARFVFDTTYLVYLGEFVDLDPPLRSYTIAVIGENASVVFGSGRRVPLLDNANNVKSGMIGWNQSGEMVFPAQAVAILLTVDSNDIVQMTNCSGGEWGNISLTLMPLRLWYGTEATSDTLSI